VNILTLPEEGVYQIEVRGRAKLTGGAFTLALAVPTNEIAFGQTVTGTVQTGEHDLWPFVGDLGQIITINLEQDESNLDAYLELIGPDGATLVQDDDGGDGYNSRIERFVLPETGLYVIVARGYSSSSGAYRLTLIKEDEAD
jgi:hypothetical protein